MYTPYDFNEAARHRMEYVEDRIKTGSPVVGMSINAGVLLTTIRGGQRKVFEVYDRLMMSAIGRQADIEAIRLGAVEVAHREGYERSPDDVTAHRLVGFALSPPLKASFGDQFRSPAVIRALFAEMGATPDEDIFYVLNYDGDFFQSRHVAAVGGSVPGEKAMVDRLEAFPKTATTLQAAVRESLLAWAVGMHAAETTESSDDSSELDETEKDRALTTRIREALREGVLEVGLLDRASRREGRFRLLTDAEIAPITKEFA